MAKKTAAQLAAPATFAKLRAIHPDAHCELDHRNPFELLIATVLSAQSTDKSVNLATPALFAKYPDARSLSLAKQDDVEKLLSRIGMYRQKSRNILSLAKSLVEQHGGEVPQTLAELVKLSGVGRKTANVVLGVCFGKPEGVVVDTHVQRLSQRLGWTKHTEPPEIERELMTLFPEEQWDILSHTLIFHGRRVCFAQRPACSTCGVRDDCPSADRAENVGRKAPRMRASSRDETPAGGKTTEKKAPEAAVRAEAKKKLAAQAAKSAVVKRAKKS